jgi:hypothetical protein
MRIWKRFSFWFLLALGCLILVSSAYLLTRLRPRITQAACDMIQIGMTEAELEDIIGAPPGDYYVLSWFTGTDALWTARGAAYRRKWTASSGFIIVAFDKDGKVVGKEFFDVQVSPS